VAAAKSNWGKEVGIIIVVLLGAYVALKLAQALVSKINGGSGGGSGSGSSGAGGDSYPYYTAQQAQTQSPLAKLAASLGLGGGNPSSNFNSGTPGFLSPGQLANLGDAQLTSLLNFNDQSIDNAGDFSIPTIPYEPFVQTTNFDFNGPETENASGGDAGLPDTGAAEDDNGGAMIGDDGY
jgi:hypothetical protein